MSSLNSLNNMENILVFWFGEGSFDYRSGLWWRGIHPTLKDLQSVESTDNFIKNSWGNLLTEYIDTNIDLFSAEHSLKSWTTSTEGLVALMILFDQFTRNIFRGEKLAFAFDHYALSIARHLFTHHYDELPEAYKFFVCVAFVHSEDIVTVADAVYNMLKLANETKTEKWKKGLLKTAGVAQEHLDVLKRFGRYPHRNVLLNRESTVEEIDFLASKRLPNWMKSQEAKDEKKIPAPESNEKDLVNEPSNDIEVKKKLKILVLHSNRQTAQSFKMKTERILEKQLKSIADLVYVDAPMLYRPAGEAYDVIKGNDYENIPNVGHTRTWWNASDDPKTMIYHGLEDSLLYLDALFQNDHYDGIIGFSQGASLTGVVASLVYDLRQGKSVPVSLTHIEHSLKFVTMISGFYCRDTRPEYAHCLLEEIPSEHSAALVKIRQDLISIPSFHSWGLEDTLVDPWRSQKLSDAFGAEQKTICTHPSTHFLKAVKYWPVGKLFDWLKQFVVVITDPVQERLNEEELLKKQCEDFITRFIASASSSPSTQSEKAKHDVWLAELDQMTNIEPDTWKILIDLDTHYAQQVQNESADSTTTAQPVLTHFRPLLCHLLATKLKELYVKYIIHGSTSGRPSLKLLLAAPRYNHLYRDTKLYHEMSLALATQLNIFASDETAQVQAIQEIHPKRQLLLSYNQYRKVISKLVVVVSPPSKPNPPARRIVPIPRNELTALLTRPLSESIRHPRPEPVDISPPELLAPLHTFLQAQEEAKQQKVAAEVFALGNNIAFERGTVCSDGRLDLCKQVIGPGGVSDLLKSLTMDSLSSHPKVKHLLLGNNFCGNALGQGIGAFIRSGQSALTTWYIAGNQLDVQGITPICDALAEDTQVRQLWLKRNPVYALGIPPIVKMLHTNSYLQILDLTNTGLLDAGAIRLFEESVHLGSLQYLYLSSNGLTALSCTVIAAKLHQTNLIQIGLGCNRLGDEGVIALLPAILHPECHLKALEIASCGIGPDGVKQLATAMKQNTSLVTLNMGYLKSTNDLEEVPNMFGSQGAVYLADMLGYNTTLRSLDLVCTGIQQAGIKALADILASSKSVVQAPKQLNTTLFYLHLEQFGIPYNELSRELIRKSLQKNREVFSAAKDGQQLLQQIEQLINPPHLIDIQSVYRIQ